MYKEVKKALEDAGFKLNLEVRVRGFVNPEVMQIYGGNGTSLLLHRNQSGYIWLYKQIANSLDTADIAKTTDIIKQAARPALKK